MGGGGVYYESLCLRVLASETPLIRRITADALSPHAYSRRMKKKKEEKEEEGRELAFLKSKAVKTVVSRQADHFMQLPDHIPGTELNNAFCEVHMVRCQGITRKLHTASLD